VLEAKTLTSRTNVWPRPRSFGLGLSRLASAWPRCSLSSIAKKRLSSPFAHYKTSRNAADSCVSWCSIRIPSSLHLCHQQWILHIVTFRQTQPWLSTAAAPLLARDVNEARLLEAKAKAEAKAEHQTKIVCKNITFKKLLLVTCSLSISVLLVNIRSQFRHSRSVITMIQFSVEFGLETEAGLEA